MADGRITGQIAGDGLAKLEVDSLGLDQIDQRLLESIVDKFSGGPVGLDTLAASIGEDADTIMDILRALPSSIGISGPHPQGEEWPPGEHTRTWGGTFPRRLRRPKSRLL